MRARVSGTAAFALIVLLSAAALGIAQTTPMPQEAPAAPPPPGFVPPYEIMRTVRAAGFDPLSPPLREGTTYVLRATDFRGILMRVVVDARTGAIRDANRIVPGPGNYGPGYDGQLGMVAPYEPSPEDMSPPYRPPPPFDTPEMSPNTQGAMPPPPPRPPAAHVAASATGASVPPLPRPRPAALAARGSAADANAGDKTPPNPAATSAVKGDLKSEAVPAAAPAAPAAPRKVPAVVPQLND